MKNWILRWYLRQVLSRPIIYAIQWTPEERNAFDAFCKSSCGLRLFEYLRQVIASTTFAAVYKDNVSANAYARGQQDVLALLHRLRVFPEESAIAELGDEEQTLPQGARQSDDWRWMGGSGAIG